MSTLTVHGLRPANEFLNHALWADIGQPVTLSIRPTGRSQRDEPRHEFLIQRSGEKRYTVLNGWRNLSWAGSDTVDRDMFAEYPLALQTFVNTENALKRMVSLRVQGLENIPHLKIRGDGILTLRLHSGWSYLAMKDCGYLSKEDPIVKEFERRWSLEAADQLRADATIRIERLLKLGPFQTD